MCRKCQLAIVPVPEPKLFTIVDSVRIVLNGLALTPGATHTVRITGVAGITLNVDTISFGEIVQVLLLDNSYSLLSLRLQPPGTQLRSNIPSSLLMLKFLLSRGFGDSYVARYPIRSINSTYF